MAINKEKLFTDFPPIAREQWMEKVTADLKGAPYDKKLVWRTAEGFSLQPVYFRDDIANLPSVHTAPNQFPFVRSTKLHNEWYIRQDLVVEDPQETNQKALVLLQKGVTSLGFRLKKEHLTVEAFSLLLKGIDLTAIEINFSSCMHNTLPLVEQWVQYVQKEGIDPQKVHGSVQYNPYKKELNKGVVASLEERSEQIEAIWNAAKPLPNIRLFAVDSYLLNNAGAYITQELGYALAWGAQLVEILTGLGHPLEEVTKRIKFNFGISANYFMEIAKFRAARWLWAEIIGAHGEAYQNETAKIAMHAITSQWNMTLYDPYVNLLRTQTETMSAAIAGVDSITVLPFDTPYAPANEFSERLARNQQLLLSEESHFDKVIDPAGGSYYIETLTHSIAQEAWKLFLSVDEQGGFEKQVTSGAVQQAINASNTKRHQAVAQRRETLLGTNEFPNFSEKALEQAQNRPDPATSHHCNCKTKATIEPLCYNRAAVEFEELRLSTEQQAHQPVVFMLTIGNLAMRLARSQFAGNFFGCAGYKLIDNLGFQTVQEGVDAALKAKADIVVLCSSDDEYATYAPEAFELLQDRALFVVAGNPPSAEQLKEQGIKHFIHVKSNVLETLTFFNNYFQKN